MVPSPAERQRPGRADRAQTATAPIQAIPAAAPEGHPAAVPEDHPEAARAELHAEVQAVHPAARQPVKTAFNTELSRALDDNSIWTLTYHIISVNIVEEKISIFRAG